MEDAGVCEGAGEELAHGVLRYAGSLGDLGIGVVLPLLLFPEGTGETVAFVGNFLQNHGCTSSLTGFAGEACQIGEKLPRLWVFQNLKI